MAEFWNTQKQVMHGVCLDFYHRQDGVGGSTLVMVLGGLVVLSKDIMGIEHVRQLGYIR